MDYSFTVSHLKHSVTDAALKARFDASDARVARDQESGRSLGYGRVYFATQAEMTRAVVNWNGTPIKKHTMTISVPDGDSETALVVHLSELPPRATKHDVVAHFRALSATKTRPRAFLHSQHHSATLYMASLDDYHIFLSQDNQIFMTKRIRVRPGQG